MSLATEAARLADTLATATGEGDELRRLPDHVWKQLLEGGVLRALQPRRWGGGEEHIGDFLDAVMTISRANPSAGWVAGVVGVHPWQLALFDEEAQADVWGEDPTTMHSSSYNPTGRAVRDGDGFRLSGRWSFSSGCDHCRAVNLGAVLPGGEIADFRSFLLLRDQYRIEDNWYVAGLQGTGSLDFRVEGLFVPEEMTYDLGIPAVRGGDLFRLGMPAFVSNEVPPLCVGLARRALDDMTELALHTARFPGGPTVSDRAVFHKELGRAETKLRAARLVHREAMADCWEMACAGDPPSEEQQLAVTAASVFAVETAAEVVSDLFRYGGGRVLALSNPMQRHLRNALAARQHLALSEEGYEAAGRYRLESAKSRRS